MRWSRAVLLSVLLPIPAVAQRFPTPPVVDVEEHLGRQIPLELRFADQNGRSVKLGDVISAEVPTLLVFAYYECPMLCGLVLKGAASAIGKLDWELGRQYRVVTVSIDPKDAPHNADLKRRSVVASLERRNVGELWPFLVGKQESIRSLTDAVGFKYTYDDRTQQYMHPAALIVLEPGGRVSRYLYGLDFPVAELRRALIDAAAGKSGSAFDRFILTCFHYDPTTRRFGPYVYGFLRAGSMLVGLGLALLIGRMMLREREAHTR